MNMINDQLVLIVGYSATGKSASLRNIPNQERWVYMNTEAGKRLPFKNNFNGGIITESYQVISTLNDIIAAGPNAVDGIIIDSMTFLMEMFESQYCINGSDTRKAWQEYNQFFKCILQEKVASLSVPVVITAHVKDDYDEKNMEIKTSVPVKGSLKSNGIEAYFSCIVAAKKIAISDLESYNSDLLTITDEDKDLGYKHVFQTRPTKKTTGERIRSPMGLFTKEQTYMDNDVFLLLKHLKEFYA